MKTNYIHQLNGKLSIYVFYSEIISNQINSDIKTNQVLGQFLSLPKNSPLPNPPHLTQLTSIGSKGESLAFWFGFWKKIGVAEFAARTNNKNNCRTISRNMHDFRSHLA